MSQPSNPLPSHRPNNLPVSTKTRVNIGSAPTRPPHLPSPPMFASLPTPPHSPYTRPPLKAMVTAPRSPSNHIRATQQYSFDDQAIRIRIINIIAPKLPMAHPNNTATLATHISQVLTRMKRLGELGPRGITSVNNVFLGVGYEGMNCYMGLMVNAPDAGAVRTFFRGDMLEIAAKLAMSSEQAMHELEKRFVSALSRQYDQIRDAKLPQKRW